MEIVIDENGQVRAIHNDALMPVLEALGGDIKIRRASHVEPFTGLSNQAQNEFLAQDTGQGAALGTDWAADMSPAGWFADMSPSGGPVGGPFATRQAALDWERDWLLAHDIPLPV